MSRSVLSGSSPPCVWMSAGLLTYKLCDRDFQCDRCPLDSALRGNGSRSLGCQSLRTPDVSSADFPSDRHYSRGHAWVQQAESGRAYWRFGLDAFAAAIMGHCRQVTWRDSQGPFVPGDPVCAVDFGLGVISIGIPVSCQQFAVNPRLLADPDQLVEDPYGDGWMAELIGSDATAADGLLDADAAREEAFRDLQWFRRQAALRFLAGNIAGADGSHHAFQFVDLREMLGGPTYLQLLPELVH